MAQTYKTEDGKQFHASDYYYVPDAEKPSTWKLRRTDTPGGKPDPKIVGAAMAAMTSNHRGEPVEVPESARAGIMDKIRHDWKECHPGEDIPAQLSKMQPGMSAIHTPVPMGSEKDSQAAKRKKKVNGALDAAMYRSVLKSHAESRYTLGVVYEPDAVDYQGDFAKAEDIEKAAWEFGKMLYNLGNDSREIAKALLAAEDGNQVQISVTEDLLHKLADDPEPIAKGALGLQHMYWGDDLGHIVESYIAQQDMTIGDQTVKKGSWLMGVIWSPKAWEMVKSGKITGYSMGGKAKKAAA